MAVIKYIFYYIIGLYESNALDDVELNDDANL